MMRVTVQVPGRLQPDVAERIVPTLIAVGEHLRNAINVYPPPPRHPIRWASERQKRYVLANVSPLPYRRQTRPIRLATSFRLRVGRLRVDVISNAPYARYVIGDRQQPFHADTGWIRASDVVQRERDAVIRIATKVLTR